jgi:L-amino acid N-acyltransferase
MLAAAEVSRDAFPGLMLNETEISIREATDVDLPVLVEILNQEIRESPYVYLDAPAALQERQRWLVEHQDAGLPVLVAESAVRRVAGWGALSPYRSSNGYRFTVEASVYVAHDSQRRGIGQRLLLTLMEEARALGMHAIIASIDSENQPSIALFERAGFREAARLAEVGRKFEVWRTQLLLLVRI